MQPETLLKFAEVSARVRKGRTNIYKEIGLGTFPKPIRLNTGKSSRVAWLESEVLAWVASRAQARTG